jgi:DnaK suppressor protein
VDADRARILLDAERGRVVQLLAALAADQAGVQVGIDEPVDSGDGAERLTEEGTQEVVEASLRRRLAALDRAEQRLAAGTFGRSIRSGRVIPDERLEADPAAELLVDEAPDGA